MGGTADDLHERPQFPRLDPLLERQGADAIGVQPEGDVLAQPLAGVDRLAVAEQALVREFQGQVAVFREVLFDAPAEVLEELLVQRVVRQIEREAAVGLEERLDDLAGGNGLRARAAARILVGTGRPAGRGGPRNPGVRPSVRSAERRRSPVTRPSTSSV